MIAQKILRIAGEKILKLICYGACPRGNITGTFETIDQSRKKLKINWLKDVVYRITKT